MAKVTTTPNAPHPALALSLARMRAATVAQLGEAIEWYQRGEDIGVYRMPVMEALRGIHAPTALGAP